MFKEQPFLWGGHLLWSYYVSSSSSAEECHTIFSTCPTSNLPCLSSKKSTKCHSPSSNRKCECWNKDPQRPTSNSVISTVSLSHTHSACALVFGCRFVCLRKRRGYRKATNALEVKSSYVCLVKHSSRMFERKKKKMGPYARGRRCRPDSFLVLFPPLGKPQWSILFGIEVAMEGVRYR